MAKHEERRQGRMFHSAIAILLLITGGGLIGFGIWMTVAENKGPFNLEYTGSGDILDVILRTNIITFIAGGFVLLSGIAALVSIARNCIGKTFRVVYFLMAIILFVVFAGLCVLSAIILARKDSTQFKGFMRDAWKETATNSETVEVVCHIENTFECRGLFPDDCKDCKYGNETQCANPINETFWKPGDKAVSIAVRASNDSDLIMQASDRCAYCDNQSYEIDTAVGCYDKISHLLRNAFLPVSIVSGILAMLIFVDFFILCCGL